MEHDKVQWVKKKLQASEWSALSRISRRELLSHGFLGLSAMAFFPPLIRNALADSTPNSSTARLPFLAFDLAGGASLPGNFLVTGKSGDLLPTYDLLGWNPHESGALDGSFGLAMSVKYSKMREGLYSAASPQALANLRFSSFAHYSQDDSSDNFTSAAALVARLESNYGVHLRKGTGTMSSLSGGKTQAALQSTAMAPHTVLAIHDIINALSFGPAFNGASSEITQTVSSLSRQLAAAQDISLGDFEGGNELLKNSDAMYEKSAIYHAGIPNSDPRKHSEVAAIYGLSDGTGPAEENAIAAAIVLNVLNGNTGPGVITIPDCDYHNGSQTTGDAKDLTIGVHIGRAVETAHRLKTPLFFQILTDGGIYADKGTRTWRGDAGDKSMTVIGFYHPSSPYSVSRPQIGHYTEGQGAERKTLVGSETTKVAYAVFANYLQVSNRLGEFSKLAEGIFPGEQLEEVLTFG